MKFGIDGNFQPDSGDPLAFLASSEQTRVANASWRLPAMNSAARQKMDQKGKNPDARSIGANL